MPIMHNLNRVKKWVGGNPSNDEDDDEQCFRWKKIKQEQRKGYADPKLWSCRYRMVCLKKNKKKKKMEEFIRN